MTEAGASAGPIAAADRAGTVLGPVLVVGYGNPLRSDDGAGPAVIARLEGDARLAGAELRAEHQLTPELALDASRSSLLVLVDAGVDEAPGEVSVRRIEPPAPAGRAVGSGSGPGRGIGSEAGSAPAPGSASGSEARLPDGGEPGAWTHHVEPEGIAGLAWALWGSAPPVVIVSIGAATFELGETLSDDVRAAVDRAAELVATIVAEHRRV